MSAFIPKNTRAPSATQQDNPRVTRAWAFYDWANSSYALVINTALVPLYVQAVLTGAPLIVSVFGYAITGLSSEPLFVVLAIFDIIAAIVILMVAREIVKDPEPATQTGHGGTLLPV